jgi:murein DD-endopeptidase MepM/ murein hydrolase activator NlpD
MDNTMVRYRYASRQPFAARRRRKAPRQGNKLRKLIMLQSVACIVLLLIIMAARSINITAANFITSQAGYVLQHDIEFKSILSNMENFIADIRNRFSPDLQVSDELTSQGSHDSEGAGAEASEADVILASNNNDTTDADMPFEDGKQLSTGSDEAGIFPETSVLSASSENGAERVSDMIEPAEGTLATPFGEIRDIATGSIKMHKGIDIDTRLGSDVKAVLDGEIAGTGTSPEYGSYVEIQHYNGLRTVYANCGEITVNKGSIVKRGDIIARTCDGGVLAGSHLHFEIWDGEHAVDPLEHVSVPAR